MTLREDIETLYKQFVIPTYAPEMVIVKGKGCRIWDADNREYLDFGAGIAVTGIGHCHPRLVEAICKQAGTLMHVSNLYFNELQPRLAQALSERSLQGKCFFCNSGAEANEALIKLARLWGQPRGRFRVLTMQKSFHGRTLATLTATGQEKVKKGFSPLPEGFDFAEFNNIDSCKKALNEKTAAILVEPIIGEGGVLPADPDFLTGLRALCDEAGILLLCDEVQSGMGRTGYWFGYQNYGIRPDAISLAKGLGNGYPIGAIVTTPEAADVFQPGHHASTFGGTPLACAAALAVIDVIEEEDLVANAARRGTQLANGLAKLAQDHPEIREVRGKGLLVAVEMDRPAGEIIAEARARGLIVLPAGPQVVRLAPPLIIGDEEINEALDKLDKSLFAWKEKAEDEK